MKKVWKVALLLWLASRLMIIGCFGVYAEEATFGTEGNGDYTTTFYVVAEKNAQLTLLQSKGTCYELTANPIKWFFGKGSQKEWGKFHIVYFDENHGYQVDWQGSIFKEKLELTFPTPGMYVVEVIPFTKDEMNENWINDYFISWTEAPKWWIANYENCKFYAYNPVTIVDEFKDPTNSNPLTIQAVTEERENNKPEN